MRVCITGAAPIATDVLNFMRCALGVCFTEGIYIQYTVVNSDVIFSWIKNVEFTLKCKNCQHRYTAQHLVRDVLIVAKVGFNSLTRLCYVKDTRIPVRQFCVQAAIMFNRHKEAIHMSYLSV